MIASGPGKQLDSLEERETELSMSWVSSAVTCTAKFRMHQQVALPWALAIFFLAHISGICSVIWGICLDISPRFLMIKTQIQCV